MLVKINKVHLTAEELPVIYVVCSDNHREATVVDVLCRNCNFWTWTSVPTGPRHTLPHETPMCFISDGPPYCGGFDMLIESLFLFDRLPLVSHKQ